MWTTFSRFRKESRKDLPHPGAAIWTNGETGAEFVRNITERDPAPRRAPLGGEIQPVVRLVSSMRKLVASDESSVPVSFTVTDLPTYGVMSIVFST